MPPTANAGVRMLLLSSLEGVVTTFLVKKGIKMKFISKQNTIQHSNSDSCVVWEYPLQQPVCDLAVACITGRYPDERRAVNTACDELVYILEGTGEIVIEHTHYKLETGDAILIQSGEKYYWEGSFKILMTCRPVWNPEQHQNVE